MRANRYLPILLLGLVALGLIFFATRFPAQAQGQNLLTNPSFEGQYSGYVPESPAEQADCSLGICSTAQTATGWKPWWIKERPTDVNPEFKPAQRNVGGSRVRTGERAAQYFSFWTTHKAGLRQTVTVPANSVVQFTIWGHTWMSESDTTLTSDGGTPNMRIGIDPTGGSNPYGPQIVWSEYKQAFDTYQPFSVQAQAQGDKVTVFTFAAPSTNPNSPDYGFKHTDMYWDDAALVVVGAGAAPPPPPADSGGGAATNPNPQPAAAAPATQFGGDPTATPDAEGIIYAEVRSGDSIWAVAARAGITLDEILELNDLSRDDFVHTGDLLIVGFGDPLGEEPVAEEAPQEDAESETNSEESSEEEIQATSIPVAEEASQTSSEEEEEMAAGVSICLAAYDDVNQSGVFDAGEELRPDVAFTIFDGQQVVSNYVTDGSSEPFCLEGLEAGSYRITRSSLPNEALTTPGDRAVSLTEGSSLELEFGSFIDQETLALASEEGEAQESSPSEEQTTGGMDEDTLTTVVIGAVILALLLLVAVIVVIIVGRRKTA